jgi:quinolinate synthase
VLAHPECKSGVLALADYVGSTAAILKYAQTDDCDTYLVVTESGILHEMQKSIPGKRFIPVPPEISMAGSCSCNECDYMRMNTMDKLYNCLKYEWPQVELDENMREDALRPIERMLEISANIKS